MNNINEWKDYPPAEDDWSDEKREEYKKLIEINIALKKIGPIIDKWVNDPETHRKKEEYLRLKREGKT